MDNSNNKYYSTHLTNIDIEKENDPEILRMKLKGKQSRMKFCWWSIVWLVICLITLLIHVLLRLPCGNSHEIAGGVTSKNLTNMTPTAEAFTMGYNFHETKLELSSISRCHTPMNSF